MKSIVNKDFGVAVADLLERSVEQSLANVYVMLGKATAYNATDSITDPYDSVQYKNDVLKAGVILKKVTSSDLQVVVPRIDWNFGNVYQAYHQTSNIFTNRSVSDIGTVNISSGSRIVISSGTLGGTVSVGILLQVGSETKEVVEVTNSTALVVNTSFSSTYSLTNAYSINFVNGGYYNQYYVKNGSDQVFKCLANANGAISTSQPAISLGGQLPQSPYIETADGYKWKYLYTIPNGLKSKFFTSTHMPALRESSVYSYSVDGRIDIINILNGGSDYYSGGSVSNYAIAQVNGDGTGANVTVDITNGVITDINILSGGTGYSYATVTVSDPSQNVGGSTASLEAVISPPNGHGYNPPRELGASGLMFSVDFAGDVSGYYPIASDGTDDFRQVALIKDPKTTTGNAVSNSIVSAFTTIYVGNPPAEYEHDSNVYVGSSFTDATFTGRVIHFDTGNNIVYVNQTTGTTDGIEEQNLYSKENPAAVAKIFSVVAPPINILSGEVLYVENRTPVVRSQSQTETVKLVLEF